MATGQPGKIEPTAPPIDKLRTVGSVLEIENRLTWGGKRSAAVNRTMGTRRDISTGRATSQYGRSAPLFLACWRLLEWPIYQAEMRWTPIQRYWLPNYLKMHLAAGLGFNASNYRLLEVEDGQGRHRSAVENGCRAVGRPLPAGGTVPLTVSKEATRQDLRLVLEPKGQYKNKELSDYIRHWIYQDQTWGDSLYWPLVTGAAVFGWVIDLRHSQRLAAAAGAQVRAQDQRPELATAAQFNRQPTIEWHRFHHKRAAHAG